MQRPSDAINLVARAFDPSGETKAVLEYLMHLEAQVEEFDQLKTDLSVVLATLERKGICACKYEASNWHEEDCPAYPKDGSA